jgi:antitoxin ParD1/3/4
MGQVEKISVALTPELAQAVRETVQAGEYASTSEVIREALREWRLRREERAEAALALRALWEEGLRSGTADEADAVFARLRRRIGETSAGR